MPIPKVTTTRTGTDRRRRMGGQSSAAREV
jgi:hypothetical protein